jgi:lysophospholipase L1-like esterase
MVSFITIIRERSFTILIFIYIFILHAVLISFILQPNLAYRLAIKLKLSPTNEFVINFKAAMNTMHARVDQNTAPSSMIFVGDSLIQGLAVSSIHPNAVNFGIGHDTVNGVLKRSSHYQSLESATSVILSVGVNDLRKKSLNNVIADYKVMLRQLRRIPNIYVHEVLPVDSKVLGADLQKKIILFNEDLFKLTIDFDNITLLESSSKLINSNGDLKSFLHLGDGLHLNKHGYDIWIQQLKQQLEVK